MENVIYWAVVRNQTKRDTYIELTYIGNNKWEAIFGDQEFKFSSAGQDFLSVLVDAVKNIEDTN